MKEAAMKKWLEHEAEKQAKKQRKQEVCLCVKELLFSDTFTVIFRFSSSQLHVGVGLLWMMDQYYQYEVYVTLKV